LPLISTSSYSTPELGIIMQDNRYYGEFGGQYVSESLMNTLNELEKAFDEAIKDPQFIKEYMYYLKEYVGRETPHTVRQTLHNICYPA